MLSKTMAWGDALWHIIQVLTRSTAAHTLLNPPWRSRRPVPLPPSCLCCRQWCLPLPQPTLPPSPIILPALSQTEEAAAPSPLQVVVVPAAALDSTLFFIAEVREVSSNLGEACDASRPGSSFPTTSSILSVIICWHIEEK